MVQHAQRKHFEVDLFAAFKGEKFPDLRHVPEPARYYLIIRQLGIKEKIGSVLLPDSAKDAQSYTHGVGVVLKVGPAAFKGRKFEDMGLTNEQGPKPGDVVQFQARGVPTRFKVQDIELLAIPDDAYYATVLPEQVPYVSFAL